MLYYNGIYGWESIVKNEITPSVVFSYYLGFPIVMGKVFNSPLRKDDNPSFAIFEGRGELLYKDFATGESGNCIKFVQELFHISRENAVIKILVDLFRSNLSPSNGKVIPTYHSHRDEVSIGLKTVPFNESNLKYWKGYYIDEDTLNIFNVFAVSHVWINDNLVWKETEKEPIYAYITDKKIKVYRPKSRKTAKWAGNTTSGNIFGYEQLPDSGKILVITKSGKDVMVLDTLGYNSVAPNSETSLVPMDIMFDLTLRFQKVYVLMDNDPAGIAASDKYCNEYPDVIPIFLSTEKDISDYIKKYGPEKTKELLCNLIK